MDLATEYLGLRLRNPLVAGASPLSRTADGVRRLADAGVAAVVLMSLFEEQLRDGDDDAARRYRRLLERSVSTVDVPVIASLNCATVGSWTDYARTLADAGAAALECNIYYLPADIDVDGRDVEDRYLDIVAAIRAAVDIPVSVKLGPYFSSMGQMARRLADAGADGLVPGLGNVDPAGYLRLWKAVQAADWATALAEQNRLNKLMEIAFVPQGRSGDAGGIGGFKTALELLGVIDSATMPAPLALLSDADRDAIRAILVEVDLLS